MKTETSTTFTTTHSTTHSTTPSTTPSTTQSTTRKPQPVNVVLITGGDNRADQNATLHSAEIFLPNSPDTPCILPELPEQFTEQTQDGGMICGGLYTRNYCYAWNSTEGKFPKTPVHKFAPARYHHVSWTPVSEKETFLIGGGSSKPKSGAHNSTNTLTPGVFMGRKGFDLKNQYILYGACSIADPETDTVIITGGNAFDQPRFKLTSLYNEDGFIENFGNLTHRREFHGCTSYVANKKRVGN